MGRMLESLKRGEGTFVPRTDKPHVPAASTPRQDTDAPDVEAGEVPFIEIGGRGKGIEASAAVLNSAPAAKPSHSKAVARPLVAALSESKPLQVDYEPWPRPPATPRLVAAELVAFHQPEHPVSKQYAELLNAMLAGLSAHASPALLLCGSARNVGTTTVLLNLAVCGSRTHSRVVLLDANPAEPALAKRLGIDVSPGWTEILAGTATLEQALHPLSAPALHVLPMGDAGAAKLRVEAVRWVLTWLRERFDLILIDGPELKQISDLAILAGSADAVYLVVPDKDMSPAQLSVLTQPLTRQGGRVRGMIRTHYEN